MTPELLDESDIGGFVVGEPEFGLGRLVGLDKATARIRYFQGPIADPYLEFECDPEQVVKARVQPHTRVYFHDGRQWKIGRVDSEHPAGDVRYVVALPNLEGDILSQDQFDVRWRLPIKDPYAVLASLGGDSPKVYGPRVDLIASWHRQRSAAAGVEGLFLGSVELHDHQLTAVRSISNDQDRRYILADEVGLGKTIEAGAIVWQSLRACPASDVLVLTPAHLRQQWAEELLGKFHISSFPEATIGVRSHEDFETWSGAVDILVVDEAHHLTRAGPYPQEVLTGVARLAHEAREVLLLSATPVRSNEAAFLDLLHLLDPKHYRLEDLDSFTRRVEMRDEIALVHHSLTPELDEFEFSLYADQLRSAFPEDAALSLLVEEAVDSADEQRPDRIARVKDYLSEAYRLHHRLIRTRRSAEICSTFGVRGRCRGRPFTVEVDDGTDGLREGLIESFRQHLAELVDSGVIGDSEARDALRVLSQACGSLPPAIKELLDANGSVGVLGLVRRWLISIGDSWLRDLDAMAPLLLEATVREIGAMSVTRDMGKVVVASSYSTVALAVFSESAGYLGKHRVASHVVGQSPEENCANVERWRSDETCRILVCDASAEEGINLQPADVIIHLDLPWDVLALEQRLGRADRFSRYKSHPVESMVFMYGHQAYALGWFLFAADSCKVFDESVSSLQYVLADLESDVLGQAIRGGPGVFDAGTEVWREMLEVEAIRLAAHDSLDSATDRYQDLNKRLLIEDEDAHFGRSLQAWLTGVGARVRRPAEGSFEIASRPRRPVARQRTGAVAPFRGATARTYRKSGSQGAGSDCTAPSRRRSWRCVRIHAPRQ